MRPSQERRVRAMLAKPLSLLHCPKLQNQLLGPGAGNLELLCQPLQGWQGSTLEQDHDTAPAPASATARAEDPALWSDVHQRVHHAIGLG